MSFNFDNLDSSDTVEEKKRRLEKAAEEAIKAESQAKADLLKESVRRSTEDISSRRKLALANEDKGWIEKYRHSSLFKG